MKRALALAALASIVLTGAGSADSRAALRAQAATYYARVASIAKTTGRDTAMVYYQRLIDDEALQDEAVPSGVAPSAWSYSVAAISGLDESLASQLLSGSYVPMASIRGLGETLLRSSLDGTRQPVAVYVPQGFAPGSKVALTVFLHGSGESETQLLGSDMMQRLAERNDTIIVAPYGRGYSGFRGSESDVYDALDAAVRTFAPDPHRRYLAGYSMGGFSVFRLAPMRASEWSAVISIAGSLMRGEAGHLMRTMRNTPFYVLTGSADQVVPTSLPQTTAAYLRDHGAPVSLYVQPGGTHWLTTLAPIMFQAWDDAEHGVLRTPTVPAAGELPLPVGVAPAGPAGPWTQG